MADTTVALDPDRLRSTSGTLGAAAAALAAVAARAGLARPDAPPGSALTALTGPTAALRRLSTLARELDDWAASAAAAGTRLAAGDGAAAGRLAGLDEQCRSARNRPGDTDTAGTIGVRPP